MEFLKNKNLMTRKEHKCVGCLRKFPKGTKMNAVTFKDETIQTHYWCETCQAYWNEFMQPGDEIHQGDLKAEDFDRWESVRKEVENPCQDE